MNELTIDEQFECFLDTLREGGSSVWSQDDEYVSWTLYEQLFADAWAFLHHTTLARLEQAGFIDTPISNECGVIRNRVIELTDAWRKRSIEEHRASDEWHSLTAMCDRVLALVLDRNRSAEGP